MQNARLGHWSHDLWQRHHVCRRGPARDHRRRDAVAAAQPRRSDKQVYAFRMIGIMLTSGAIVLALSAGAMWQWTLES
ncbi:hypothetical protein [Sphingomonas sp. Ant20]|uniref:hypothetical protein n=1 Tax=Sphingomonas sp. Ant20 TaxID=104605 RepID=UPI000A8786F6|nr:hypothetical protein [Sphingomonas sp. Ant20]